MPPPPAAGSRSTIPLQPSTNLLSLPHAPIESFAIPTWSFQESYETIVSTQGGYYANTFTAPPVAQQSSGGAIAHGSAYDNDPGVTYRVTGQSASNAAAPDDSAHAVGVVAPTSAQQAPFISQPPPIDVSADVNNLQPRSVESQPAPDWRPGGSEWLDIYFWAKEVAMKTKGTNGANNVQPSATVESQPAPSWLPGGIKWLNIQYWATGVALTTSCASYNDPGYEPSPQSDETSASTPRPTRTTDATRGGMATPTAAENTAVNTLPTRAPSPSATPRPLRVINITPGRTPTPTPATNTDTRTQPIQVPQPSSPAFDIDAMVARAYDETAQATQEIDDQITTCITELAVVVTERRLFTPPPHKERPDTPTTEMAVNHLLRADLRRGFHDLLKMAIQPRYLPGPAVALLPKGTEANLRLWGSKVEETAVAEVVADTRGVHLWQPRAWGMKHMADIQRMEDIADVFAENFVKPYVPGFRG